MSVEESYSFPNASTTAPAPVLPAPAPASPSFWFWRRYYCSCLSYAARQSWLS